MMETAPEPYNDEDASSLGSDDSGYESRSDGDSTTRYTVETGKTDSSSEDIAKEGANTVLGSKLLVLLILAMATAAVGYATFDVTSKQEHQEFEQQVCRKQTFLRRQRA